MGFLQNIAAFLMPIILFCIFGCVGLATLSLLHSRKNSIQNLLLAPSVGLSITVLLTFLLNWYGLAVQDFAYGLLVFLLLASISVIYIKQPLVPLKKIWPFIIVIIFAMFLVGRPLLSFGFNWLSYGNDDMANYVLGASWFMHHGYYDIPSMQSFTEYRDYSSFYWFYYVLGLTRSGSELILAWVSSITQLSTLQVFMPLILAFFLCLITGTGAAIYQDRNYYKQAILGCFLVSISALITLGVVYQLIAQIAGMAICIPLMLLSFQNYNKLSFKHIRKNALLIALIAVPLIIVYPEISPFLILGYLLFIILQIVNKLLPSKKYFLWLVITIIAILILSGTYFLNYIGFLLPQMKLGLSAQENGALGNSFFGYYLIPSGLAYFWGLEAIWSNLSALININIVLGMIFLLVSFCLCLVMVKRRFAPAIILFVMYIMGVILYYQHNGFGLFKLAMYTQPFLIATLIVAITQIYKQQKTILILGLFSIAVVCGGNLLSQKFYVARSYGDIGASVLLPFASQDKIMDQLSSYQNKVHRNNFQSINIASDNTITQKLLALYSRNISTYILSNGNFLEADDPTVVYYDKTSLEDVFYLLRNELINAALLRKNNLFKEYKEYSFNLFNKQTNSFSFCSVINTDSKNILYIFDSPKNSIINRWQLRNEYKQATFFSLAANKISNLLVYISSELGNNFYMGLNPISLYQLEPDFYYPKNSFAAIGGYLLFQVINPNEKVRMILNISTTVNSNKQEYLPQAVVIGAERVSFQIIGRGSARVISNLVMPQEINNLAYFMLEMNSQSGKNNSGLDHRRFTAYARDISLMSDEQYQKILRPSRINKFPQDLANSNLEYSGIYEDGWIAKESYVNLLQPYSQGILQIKGSIPSVNRKLNLKRNITVFLNNIKIATKPVNIGKFDIEIPVNIISNLEQIKLIFDNTEVLPNGDNRIVAAKIDTIGFVQQIMQPTFIDKFPKDLANPKLQYSGIYADGWIAKESYINLSQPYKKGMLTIKGLIPEINNRADYKTNVTVLLNNEKIATKLLAIGNFDIKIPIYEISKLAQIKLIFDNSEILPNRDNRIIAAKLDFIGFLEQN